MTRQPSAIVTGGTRGIGLAISGRLVKLGYHVTALYRGDEHAAERAEAQYGPALRSVRANVGDPASVSTALTRVLGDQGPPDVLVNNAGLNIDRPFLSMSEDDWHRVIATNLSGPFYVTRIVAPQMLTAGLNGVIINVGATTGIRPRLRGVNYCSSKAGLIHMTRCLALELAPKIRVNCLIPGMTATDELIERFDLHDPAARQRVLETIPQQRIADAEDIADALEFLVSSRSAFMTGQRLVVDGGEFMC